MRVLHIYKDYAPILGGIENHIALLAQAQRAQGIDARVLVTNTGPETVEELINGVPVVKTGRQLNISSAPISLGFYPWLRRLEEGIDITHGCRPPIQSAGSRLHRDNLTHSHRQSPIARRPAHALFSPCQAIHLVINCPANISRLSRDTSLKVHLGKQESYTTAQLLA